ncbi:MAG: 30S ribosomal protein S3ae [Candidatus Thermoplasmatota archaeon]
MAKARSRAATRRMKDRWKSKESYKILAPSSFDNKAVADTLADDPEKLIDRVSVVTLQDLTNDFRKSHIKLFFKINKVEDNNAYTKYAGHTLTSDYLKRMIRRKSSKIEGVFDIRTRDGAKIRVKPFSTVNKRIQNSQKKVIRNAMKKTIKKIANKSTLSEFIKEIFEGNLGKKIYLDCKKLYPIKRVEIYKTEVLEDPTKEETEEPPKKEEKTSEDKEETEEKPGEKENEEEEENKEEETSEGDEEPEEEIEEEEEEKEKEE